MDRWIEMFFFGLRDAASPWSVAALGLLIAGCFFFYSNVRMVFFFAAGFMAAFFVMSLALLCGFLNDILFSAFYLSIVEGAKWTLGVLFLLVGVRSWMIWARRSFRKDATVSAAHIGGMGAAIQMKWVGMIMGGMLGIGMALVVFVWPPSYQVTIVSNDMMYPGNGFRIVRLLAGYQLFKMAGMAAVVMTVWRFRNDDNFRNVLVRRQEMVLVILSAFFIAAGCGFVYTSIQHL